MSDERFTYDDIRLLLRKMAHDIRAPLGSVISTSDMLVGGFYDPLTPKQARAADRLLRSSKRSLAIIDDFITYLKAAAGEVVLSLEPFDSRVRLAEWCMPVQIAAEAKGLTFTLVTRDSVPAEFKADVPLVQRIVMALLWNSIAYTSSGSIQLTEDWVDQRWCVTVRDTGQGISEENIDSIFEPFWRGVDRPQMPTACVGLGLSLARSLAELMQGELTLKETGEKGSTFCLKLPLEVVFFNESKGKSEAETVTEKSAQETTPSSIPSQNT